MLWHLLIYWQVSFVHFRTKQPPFPRYTGSYMARQEWFIFMSWFHHLGDLFSRLILCQRTNGAKTNATYVWLTKWSWLGDYNETMLYIKTGYSSTGFPLNIYSRGIYKVIKGWYVYCSHWYRMWLPFDTVRSKFKRWPFAIISFLLQTALELKFERKFGLKKT